MAILRAELLRGRRIAVSDGLPTAVDQTLRDLGAVLEVLAVDQLALEEEGVGAWARDRSPLHALVHCARRSFGGGGEAGLEAALELTWAAVREVAVGALIGAEEPGRLVLLAPGPDAGPLAGSCRAGLENLARTLSVEWARYELTCVAVLPGPHSSDAEVGQIVAYLVSQAGRYLSGCVLRLR